MLRIHVGSKQPVAQIARAQTAKGGAGRATSKGGAGRTAVKGGAGRNTAGRTGAGKAAGKGGTAAASSGLQKATPVKKPATAAGTPPHTGWGLTGAVFCATSGGCLDTVPVW